MFSSYKLSKNKKEVVTSSAQEKQVQIKALIKALNLKIVTSYTGMEGEATILKKEQAEDDNREKRIQEIKDKIKKISNKDKSKSLGLKNRILQKEKIIGVIGGEIKNLTARKNKAIKLYDKQNGLVDQSKVSKLVKNSSNEEIIIKEDKKSDEFLELQDKPVDALYLKAQQEYLKGIYLKEEKSLLEKKFKELKAINGQEAVMDEVRTRLLASDNNNYYMVIEHLQALITDVNATKSEDYQALNDMEVVKLAKKLSTQETLLQKHKEYLLENKENKKGSGQVEISPAYQRTKLVMEASMSRVQLNKKVVESVNQKHNARIQQYTLMGSNKPNVNNVSITHVNVAAHYCIAKLEQVDASVLEKLEKKCIQAGWSLDKQKGLVYKGAQGSILLMSDIEELSYNSYIEMGNRQLSEELELNVENAQMIVAKSADLQPSKRILPAFEQDLKKSRPKLVSNNKSTFWLFCFEKALVAVKPEVIGLIKLKASVCGEGKSNLGLSL